MYYNTTARDDLNSIRNSAQSSAFSNQMSAAANMAAAWEAAEQTAIQQDQLALQQEMAQQQADHNFAMWRQTPDGMAYVDWQKRARALLSVLQQRELMWRHAWSEYVTRLRLSVPPDETQRFFAYNNYRKPSTRGWTFAFVVCLVIGIGEMLGFVGRLALYQPSTCVEPPDMPGWCPYYPSRLASAFDFSVIFGILILVAAVLLGIFRARRIGAERARYRALRDQVTKETDARVRRWGFDPLTVNPASISFPWCDWSGFEKYTQAVRYYVLKGRTLEPHPSSLPDIELPKGRTPHERYPKEINDVLRAFMREGLST